MSRTLRAYHVRYRVKDAGTHYNEAREGYAYDLHRHVLVTATSAKRARNIARAHAGCIYPAHRLVLSPPILLADEV